MNYNLPEAGKENSLCVNLAKLQSIQSERSVVQIIKVYDSEFFNKNLNCVL